MKNRKQLLSVSVVIPARNAGTTVLITLRSLMEQTYPIKEIFVVDNVSKDTTREKVLEFAKTSKILVRLIRQDKDRGVSSSNNLGAKHAKSDLVVFTQSDCRLETKDELKKLIEPFLENKAVVATFPTTILPREIWNKYNFWQKMYMCSDLDNETPLMNAKFDCFKMDIFKAIGGYDEKNFGGEGSIGGEDADLSLRIRKEGMVVASLARIIHLQYVGSDYSIKNLLNSRKMYARTYGRLLQKRSGALGFGAIVFLIKPAIALLPFLPFFHTLGIVLLVVYAFIHTRKMFTSKLTIRNPRIILVPFLNIILLYFDTFWMIEAFFIGPSKYDIIKK